MHVFPLEPLSASTDFSAGPTHVKAFQDLLHAKESRVKKLQLLEERARTRIEKAKERSRASLTFRIRLLEERQKQDELRSRLEEQAAQHVKAAHESVQQQRGKVEFSRRLLQERKQQSAREVRKSIGSCHHIVYASQPSPAAAVPNLKALYFRELRARDQAQRRAAAAEHSSRAIADLQERLGELKKSYTDLKIAHAISPLENPIQLRAQRRAMARIATELTKREVQ